MNLQEELGHLPIAEHAGAGLDGRKQSVRQALPQDVCSDENEEARLVVPRHLRPLDEFAAPCVLVVAQDASDIVGGEPQVQRAGQMLERLLRVQRRVDDHDAVLFRPLEPALRHAVDAVKYAEDRLRSSDFLLVEPSRDASLQTRIDVENGRGFIDADDFE